MVEAERVLLPVVPASEKDTSALYEPSWTLGQRVLAARRYLIEHPVLKAGQRQATGESSTTYRFVAWDDVADSVGAALALHGIVVWPSVEEWQSESGQTRRGNPTKVWLVKLKIRVESSDNRNDYTYVTWVGGSDDPETATGLAKATTYCMKDFLLMGLQLSGDDSDQKDQPGAMVSAAAGENGGVPCPACGKPLVERTGSNGTWIRCSGWKPNKQGCNWKRDGSMAAYLEQAERKERDAEPTGEFKLGPEGEPVPVPRSEAAPPEPEIPLGPTAQAIVDTVHVIEDKAEARNAILRAGGMALVKQKDTGGWMLRRDMLASLQEPILKRVLRELEAMRGLPARVPDDGLPLGGADRAAGSE